MAVPWPPRFTDHQFPDCDVLPIDFLLELLPLPLILEHFGTEQIVYILLGLGHFRFPFCM